MVRRELCATCGKDCWQCDAEGVGKKERVEGCSACAGTCAPRIMWVGRSSTIRVHTVGEGAAVGEPWHFNEVAKVWEIGLRTNMPKNPKRNRFQWMQGHKVRLVAWIALDEPPRPRCLTRQSDVVRFDAFIRLPASRTPYPRRSGVGTQRYIGPDFRVATRAGGARGQPSACDQARTAFVQRLTFQAVRGPLCNPSRGPIWRSERKGIDTRGMGRLQEAVVETISTRRAHPIQDHPLHGKS
jgi:hypothetical protein